MLLTRTEQHSRKASNKRYRIPRSRADQMHRSKSIGSKDSSCGTLVSVDRIVFFVSLSLSFFSCAV